MRLPPPSGDDPWLIIAATIFLCIGALVWYWLWLRGQVSSPPTH